MMPHLVREKDGYVEVCPRSGGYYQLAPDQHAKVRDAWMKGEAFVDAWTLYGALTTIKLAAIETITLLTAESIAAKVADDAETRRERMIRGEDD